MHDLMEIIDNIVRLEDFSKEENKKAEKNLIDPFRLCHQLYCLKHFTKVNFMKIV